MLVWFVFALLVVLAAALERFFSARPPGPHAGLRLRTNLIAYAVNSGLRFVATPVVALRAVGLVDRPAWSSLEALQPVWLSWLLAFVVLDLSRYLVHRLFHLPGLWRVHASHHSDDEVDWSTALRHHPLEALAGVPIYALLLGVAGVAEEQVVALSTLALCWDLLTHANVRLPESSSRLLGLLLVTPDIHAVHHSANPSDGNRNFGTTLVLWDRLFGTYRAPQAAARAGFGLEGDAHPDRTYLGLLRLPFRNERFRSTSAQPQPR